MPFIVVVNFVQIENKKVERIVNNMKQFIRKIEEHVILYRDDKTGIAWIEDGKTGSEISVHSNINVSGNVSGMKNLGYWRKKDRTVRSHSRIYNIDSFVYDKENKLEMIVADECRCQGCLERKMQKAI